MALTAEKKAEIVKEYQVGEGDTGSPEVQVALLTANIEQLQAHSADGGPAVERAAGDLSTTSPEVYSLVDNPEAFEAFLGELSKQSSFSVDTETTSLRPVDCEVVGLSFSWERGKGATRSGASSIA